MWCRVLKRAFERLELLEGELSRAVLRGGDDGNIVSLPDRWERAAFLILPARGILHRQVGRASGTSLAAYFTQQYGNGGHVEQNKTIPKE
jgi:hypothetical protein